MDSPKVGLASSDWSHSVKADSGLPATGGSGWIRFAQYLPYLTGKVDITAIGKLAWMDDIEMFGVENWADSEIHGDFDILYIQRYMNSGIAEKIKASKKRHDTIFVQEIDDWYWGLDKSNLAYTRTHPKLNPDNNINHYKKSLQASDYVITSTPYLADRLSAFVKAERIIVFENHADLSRFSQREHTSGRPVIGWVGSTAHRSGDLEIMRGILSQLVDDFDFVHVGHKDNDPDFQSFAHKVGLPPERVKTYPFYRPDDLYENGFPFDIGIVPLTDKPFNHAKSWIKGLEYTGAGVPFVASPSTEYKRLRDEYGVGRIAKNAQQWVKHIRALADSDVRKSEATLNFAKVQNLDVTLGALRLEDILASLV